MKRNIIKLLSGLTFLAMAAAFLSACKDDNGADPKVDTSKDMFWLYSRIGEYPDQADLIAEVTREDIEDPNFTFTLKGNGAEVQQKITYGQVVKDGYYYCVSKDQRFGKYKIKNGQLIAEMEVPYTRLYNAFSFAWKNDNTLVIFGPDGNGDKLVYSEINTNTLDMKNGELAIPAFPAGYDRVRTQEAVYRDGKIFLGYQVYNSTAYNVQPGLRVLVLDASTYQAEKTITDSRSDNFGDGNGGRFQSGILKDKSGNIYVSASPGYNSGNTTSYLLRINSGATEFDPNYEGFKSSTIKLSGIWDLGNGKAILRTDDSALGTGGSTFVCEHNVFELSTGKKTKLDIPAGDSGSQMNVAVDQENGKAYIMTNASRSANNNIYIYSISAETVTKGMIIPPGYNWLLRLDYIGSN